MTQSRKFRVSAVTRPAGGDSEAGQPDLPIIFNSSQSPPPPAVPQNPAPCDPAPDLAPQKNSSRCWGSQGRLKSHTGFEIQNCPCDRESSPSRAPQTKSRISM